ncbi:hypothetical protein JCM9279_002652 [Rhodotorula babjevae]
MPPRRSSRTQAPSAQLAPPSRADSSSSSSTHGRRSKSCDSTATDSTALTPVPEAESKEATACAVHESVAPEHDEDDNLESDTSSSLRRSSRTSGVAKPNYALVNAGEVDAPRAGKRRSSTGSERKGSPVTTRSKRRRASERSSECGADEAASASPILDTPRRSPAVDEPEATSVKPDEQVAATADSSPLTSPPDTSFGSSVATGSILPASNSTETLSGSAAAIEGGDAVLVEEVPVVELEVAPILDDGEAAQPLQGQALVKPVPELVALRSSRRLAGIVPAVPVPSKKRRALAPPMPKDWFEVIVRGDAYAVVTAAASSTSRARSPPVSALAPLAIVRHDDFSPRHSFTSYRFSLLLADEKPIRIQNVVVRLEGSRKKVSGPSAHEVEVSAGAEGEEGSRPGHWLAVLKGDKYKWVAP